MAFDPKLAQSLIEWASILLLKPVTNRRAHPNPGPMVHNSHHGCPINRRYPYIPAQELQRPCPGSSRSGGTKPTKLIRGVLPVSSEFTRDSRHPGPHLKPGRYRDPILKRRAGSIHNNALGMGGFWSTAAELVFKTLRGDFNASTRDRVGKLWSQTYPEALSALNMNVTK